MKPVTLALLGTFASVAGCTVAPTQLYSGAPRPRAEVAMISEGTNASILEIDGKQTSGRTWALLPGDHELLIRVRIHTTVPNVNWTVWSYCSVPLTAIAGEEYAARVRVRQELESGLADRVQMEVGVEDRAAVLVAVPLSCTGKRPR